MRACASRRRWRREGGGSSGVCGVSMLVKRGERELRWRVRGCGQIKERGTRSRLVGSFEFWSGQVLGTKNVKRCCSVTQNSRTRNSPKGQSAFIYCQPNDPTYHHTTTLLTLWKRVPHTPSHLTSGLVPMATNYIICPIFYYCLLVYN